MGELFNKLDHKSELGAWIATYGGYENVTTKKRPASLEYLMRFWESAKSEYLYKMFGNKFIVEKTISIETPMNEIARAMETHLYNDENMLKFRRSFKDWLKDADLTEDQRFELSFLIAPTYLAYNEYRLTTHKFSINGTPIVVQNGCKPIKVLAKIAELAGLEGFEEFRIAHSNILGKRKTTGTLCLSIHPLDYLTMSDNENGWDSCMNWRNAGCWRIGTVEMMNSPAVVVAYLKSHKEMRFFDYEWNSKKWRNLFIVDKNFIAGIKGYPYQDTYLDETCIDMLMDLAEKNLGYSYCHDIVEHYFDGECDTIEFPELERKIDFEFSTQWMYNDFGNSNTSHLVVAPNTYDVVFHYSGLPECMYCGSILDNYENYDEDTTSHVICSDCMHFIECDNCGSSIPEDEVQELDGQIFCQDCYDDRAEYDPLSGEVHDRHNMTRVFLVDETYLNVSSFNGSLTDALIDSFKDFDKFADRYPYIWVYNEALPENNVSTYYFRSKFQDFSHWGIDITYISLIANDDEEFKKSVRDIYNNYGEWY